MAGNWTNWTFIADRFSPSVCVDWTWLWTVGGQTITNMYETFDVNLPLKNILIFGRGANILVLPKALFPMTHRKLKSTLGQFEKQVNFFLIKAPFCFLVKSAYMKFIFAHSKGPRKSLGWSVSRSEIMWTGHTHPVLAAFGGFPWTGLFSCHFGCAQSTSKKMSCQGTKGCIKLWAAMPLHVSRLYF